MCWKQEEKRVKNLTEAFSISSCKYSINIGWKGGLFAQMCGHYLHFDCYNSYKQTLDQTNNSFGIPNDPFMRNGNIEYACPLCRQVANCVLPVSPQTSAQKQSNPPSSASTVATTSNDGYLQSSVASSPAKLWILSSIVEKQNQMIVDAESDTELTTNHQFTSLNEKILHLLKTRPFSNPITNTKILTLCKNDALTLITLTTPVEFRYIENSNSLYATSVSASSSIIDDDITMFTTSVLRTQLEIDLMLKHQRNDTASLGTNNFKKKRACFMPLMDVVSTHCKLMCHEFKPHVKQWLMLVDPNLYNDVKQVLPKESQLEEKSTVPLLLRDPLALFLLLIVNLPLKLDKSIFTCLVSSVFNLVYVQGIIDLCREFDEEERSIWSDTKSNSSQLKDLIRNVLLNSENKNLFVSTQSNRNLILNNYKIKTIWTNESAKNFIEQKCLHFLKITALLKSYMYNQEMNGLIWNSFEYLHKYLNLDLNISINQDWLNDLSKSYSTHKNQVENLLSLSFDTYSPPELLQLPHLYSDLFSYYLTKKCQFCSRVPKETGVCLMCGAQVCYKANCCCDQMRDFNKRHVNACGAGTFILININSTYVFVIRGKRCAPWASLYLDEHGEEDRDLR